MDARRILAGADSDGARLDGAPWAPPATMALSYGYTEGDALAASPVTLAAAFSLARSLGLPPSSCVRMVRSQAEQAFLRWGPRTAAGQVPVPPRSRSPQRRTVRPRPPTPPPPPVRPWRPSPQVLLMRVSKFASEVERYAARPEVSSDVVLLQDVVALTQRIADVGREVVQLHRYNIRARHPHHSSGGGRGRGGCHVAGPGGDEAEWADGAATWTDAGVTSQMITRQHGEQVHEPGAARGLAKGEGLKGEGQKGEGKKGGKEGGGEKGKGKW
jgi:hypothetical protein